MFEKYCSRVWSPAHLRLCSLTALIIFTNQGSNCLNCFPFTSKAKLKPSLHSLQSLLGWAFLLLPGIPGTWKASPVAIRGSLYKQQSSDTCLEKFFPGVMDDISGKDPRMARWKLISVPSKWFLWKMYPLVHSAELYCQRNGLPASLGHYHSLLKPFDIIFYRLRLALDSRNPIYP